MPTQGESSISMLFAGEFSYGEHSITYTATEENLFDIHAFSATANDMFVTINGEQYPLQQKVTEVDGVLNIPVSFAKTLGLSGDAQISQSFESENITSVCRFYMDNPEYKDETWNYEEDNFETFKYLYFWVNSDQVPCVKNDEVYVPLYDLLLEMYDGEFTFFENGLEYLATGENPLGMKKVSAFLDDNFVTVDDKKISFDNKIIEENDIIRVPLSFTTKLGMKTEGISTYYGTSYSFSMENPAYIPPLEDDIEVNHLFYHLF